MPKLNQWPWEIPEPGIYFDMPFDVYLSFPALQSSSIKTLLVSGPNFWAESWMNPKQKTKDTKAFAEGRAYHKRVLEGSEAFYQTYASDYEPDAEIGVLRSTKEIKDALVLMGLPSSFANKLEGAQRLLSKAPQKKIEVIFEHRHKAQYPGRIFLPPQMVYEIEAGAFAIEQNEYMRHWLKGGYPEVTVIWVENGIAYKCRFDYLKIGSASDLKTFANERGKKLDKAIDHAMAGNKLFIQSGLYMNQAAVKAQEFIRAGKVFPGKVDVSGKWLDLFARTRVEEFRFIFYQKGQSLVADGYIHSVHSENTQAQATLRIDEAVETFRKFYEVFGASQWVMMRPPRYIDFDSLPGFVGDL